MFPTIRRTLRRWLDATGAIAMLPIEHWKQHRDEAWTAEIKLQLEDATPKFIHFVAGERETHLTEWVISVEADDFRLDVWKDLTITPGQFHFPPQPADPFYGAEYTGKIILGSTATPPPEPHSEEDLKKRLRLIELYGAEGGGPVAASGDQGVSTWEHKIPAHHEVIARVDRPGQTGDVNVVIGLRFYVVGPKVPAPE